MNKNKLLTTCKQCLCLFLLLSIAFSASQSFASERYIRYRLIKPEVDSIANIRFITHITDGIIHVSWTGWKLPGVLSQHGLYTQSGKWSDWYKFPDPNAWGTLYLDIRAPEKITAVKVEAQVASYPDKSGVVKTVTISNDTGNSVGFILPKDILETPELIQTIAEVNANRRAVAESVAIPKEKIPRLLSFTPSGVSESPTIKGSFKEELKILKMLGFNTLGIEYSENSLDFPFRIAHNTGWSIENDQKALERYNKANPMRRPIIYSILLDEPGWYSGFKPIWKETGEKGFQEYLKRHDVNPKIFGVETLEQVRHINRKNVVKADAPIEKRRLWYWSCRYTYYAGAIYFRQRSDISRKTFPNTKTTVNFPDHSILMNRGMIAAYGPDYFEFGRNKALSMYWTEDWIFSGLKSWGNGLYQKMPFLAELLRSAARYHNKKVDLGFHVVNVGYAPFAKETDKTASLRTVMLLGKGIKNFSFFRYGPTHRGTVDFWADHAPVMRGIADAIQIAGGKNIEPYVYEGEPAPSETCIIYGTTSEYWQTQNKKDINNSEKQWLYCMLTQQQVPLEIIDSYDLNRFIGNYKAAYFIDTNIKRESAENLLEWVQKGGVLCLWPDAASLDEYNDPLDLFKVKKGRNRVGRGWIIKYETHVASDWWENTKKLCADAGSSWPSLFDFKTSAHVAEPALKLAKVSQPVTVNFPGIVADALISEKGVAVTLANLMGTFDKGGVRYLNVNVRLEHGAKDIKKAWSSRRGNLPLIREGNAVFVTLPLDSTDIVIFAK